MALTNYKYQEGHGVFHAISEGYKNPADNHWKITGAAGGFGEYAKNNKWKTAAVVSMVVTIPLVAAYFLSPAYSDFVNTTAASTYAGMIAGGKGLYALAVANPVFTALLTAAIVFTIGALIYTNCNKASQIKEQANQIDGVKKAVLYQHSLLGRQMGDVINLLNSPIIGKKSPFSFVPLPVKLGIRSLYKRHRR